MTPIEEWLRSVGLEKYAPLFAEHEITIDVLPHLTDADIDALGLPIGPRRRLSVEVQALAANARPDAPPTSAPTSPVEASGAERRQLTVMFCDLVGSTALAEHLDPEELRELMQLYRKACSEVTARYEGHVAQYLGDGLMVYFGWPRAHEDDAERGVRAALEMVQAVKGMRTARSLAVRIGLATGPVVVGDTSGGTTEARLAVGETPNLAARLQGVAGPGEIVIAPSTRRLVGDAFMLSDLGAREIKGLTEPVQVWRVDAVRRTARFEAAHAGTELTPIVGREEETSLLIRRWRQACDAEGQVVLIGGEPGIGKSRLTQALRDHITEPHVELRYQCSPYHLHSTLHPFIEQFELAAGFSRDDTPDQKLDKMEATLAADATQTAEAAPLIAALLSLPDHRYAPLSLSPQKQKERTLDVLARYVESLTHRGPLLMVIEDVHWIDPSSQELLDILVPRLQRLPILLVATYRPEHSPAWVGQPGVTVLTLNRLGQRQVARLVAEVTAGKSMPPEVVAEILSRTDGVPLFVEELTKSVIESGLVSRIGEHYALQDALSSLAIPTSLRDSLVARLDRLASVKEIAQIGACIGREFSYELLARVATVGSDQLEVALNKLVDSGLATRRGTPPDAVFTFKHALVQDAAYDSLLKSRRSQLHARIAQVLERDFANRVAGQPEYLAHHHTLAGNLVAAIPLWRQAGELALRRVALKEAIAHFQKGLGLIDQLPPSTERDGLELTIREPLNAAWTGLRGWAATDVGVNAAAILRLAKAQGNAESLLLGLWWMWTSTITQGRIADSVPWAQRLLDEGHETGDVDLRIFGHTATMVSALLRGQLVESRQQAEQALALYDPQRAKRWLQLTGHDLRTFIEVYACQLTWMLGYPDQAQRACEASTTHARDVGHAFNLVWALTFSAYVHAYRREPERLMERVGEADRLARDQGIAFISEVSVPQAAGIAHLQSERIPEAVTLLRQGLDRWIRVDGHVRVPYVKSALAEAIARQGDLDLALQLIEECLEQIERPTWQEQEWLAEVLRLKGWILIQRGHHDAAEAALRASIQCARDQQAKSWELRAAITLARLLAERGRRESAHTLLAPVYGWFTEGFDTPDLVEARALLEALGGTVAPPVP